MIREFDVWFGGWLFDVGQHGDQNGSFHMGIFAQNNSDGITQDGPCDHILPSGNLT